MKKVYLSLISAFAMFSSVAQTIGLEPGYNTINLTSVTENGVASLDPHIMNTGTFDLNVGVTRHFRQMAPGQVTYFCWDLCYDTMVNVAPDVLQIRAGNSTDLFHSYVQPFGNHGSSVVGYKFYDHDGNSTDTFEVMLSYHFSGVGISELNNSSANLSAPSPNPANDLAYITYSHNTQKQAQLIIRDLLGSMVRTIQLNSKNGILLVPTKELPSGIYLYSLLLDGKPSVSKKLVVAHR